MVNRWMDGFIHAIQSVPSINWKPFVTCRTGYYGEVPSLFQLCIQTLQEHVDSIEECGGLSFDVLQPVLERAAPASLSHIEDVNPHLLEDTGPLWERHCRRHFPRAERQEMETWRDLFLRCHDEREAKLEGLKERLQVCVGGCFMHNPTGLLNLQA